MKINGVGERLSAEAKVRRDREVIADRARGLTWLTIAGRHRLSERQCRSIWKNHWQSEATLVETDPIEAVQEALARYDAVLERLALLGECAAQESVKLGAMKAQLTALDGRTALMQAVGLLPRDLGLLRLEVDVREVARTVVRVLDEHGVPPDVQDALQEAISAASVRRNGHSQLN